MVGNLPIFKRKRKIALRVEDVMSTPAITTHRDVKVREAARIMYDNRIGCLPVVNMAGKLLGIVTERDMLFALGKCSDVDMEVWEIMSENPLRVRSGAPIMEAIRIMKEGNVRHLPVVDEEGKVIGVISLRDIIDSAMMLLEILAGS